MPANTNALALILNLETATKNCSVSLAENGIVLAVKELNDGNYSHAEKLHVFIRDVIASASKTLNQLDAVAISKGPGSFTGLRIGVSAAKGLCYALGIPLISTSTLQSLALQVDAKDSFIVPMLDARRMEVYSSVFDGANQIREIQAQVLDEHSFQEYLSQKATYFIGDGVAKTKNLISHPNAIYIENKFPSTYQMAHLSFDKFKSKDFEDVAYFEPFYLKDFLVTVSKKR